MQIHETAANHVLGLIPSDDLPAIALQALTAGSDTPSLRLLAASDTSDLEEVRGLFRKALSELKVEMPSAPEAGLVIARGVAREVLNGAITPYEGARRIWVQIYIRLPELKQLTLFVGIASEYEDDVKHREQYSRDIIEECKKLVEGSSI